MVLAVTVADGDAISLLAIVVAACVTLFVGLPAWLTYLRGRHTKAAIGTPNGGGSLVEMVERMSGRLDGIDRRLNHIEVQGNSIQSQMLVHEDADTRRFDAATAHIDRVAAEVHGVAVRLDAHLDEED